MGELVVKKRFIESSSFYTNQTSEDPFSEMRIADTRFLDALPSRSPCPRCHKSRKYYCYTCYVAVQEVAPRLPNVQLPVQVDIIKHPKEVDGKSTSAHAAVLAPDHVKIYTYPDFPSYENEKALLIFPGKSAIPFEEWWQQNTKGSSDGPLPFTKAVFIDSTWRQSKALYNDKRLKRLPCVVLSSSHRSLFWRYYRGKQESHLSTVEAIYHFLRDLHPCHAYDNLLFFFKFMYFKIRQLYDPTTLKAYAPHTPLSSE